MPMPDEVLNVTNLSAGYGEKVILEDINFAVRQGEIKVVLGESGCGKSTLLKNLIRLHQPFSGDVSLVGQSILKARIEQLNSLMLNIGVVFQSAALLSSLTVAENIALPVQQHTQLNTETIKTMIADKLQAVNMPGSGHLMPSELSGGMRKRVAFARAILMNPTLVVCDEPSAGLDPVTMKSIDQLILDLRRRYNMSFLVVTHEVNSINRIADSVLYLEEGRALFNGPLPQAMQAGIPSIDRFFNPN
jgi:phospholipid/cholesterol/gamma-HCH transport system ATP-binding protein